MTFEIMRMLPTGVTLDAEGTRPPGIAYTTDKYLILIDIDDTQPLPDSAHATRPGRTTLRLHTSAPASCVPASLRVGPPRRQKLGTSQWDGWQLRSEDGEPLLTALSAEITTRPGTMFHLPHASLLILGDEGSVPREGDNDQRLRQARNLRRVLTAFDLGEVSYICGTDLHLRTMPYGDEARAQLLALIAVLQQSSWL